MRRFGKIIAVVVLVFTLGLHWTAIQSIAWFSMILRYSQEAPFRDAVVRTFDGQHPCSLCRLVAQGRQSDHRTSERQFPGLKLDLFLESAPEFSFARSNPGPVTGSNARAGARFQKPPSPPPRFV
jgi:hypothetical protein